MSKAEAGRGRQPLIGVPVEADAPRCREVARQGNQITLHFDHAGSGLQLRGETIAALSVTAAGKDIPVRPAPDEDKLVLNLQDCQDIPVEISFANEDWYRVNLFNSEGIPAIPFHCSC